MLTQIAPFAGLRYNAQIVSDLSTVMTPPYDVISDAERSLYMTRNPYNMIHLILGAEYEADTAEDNRFTRAQALLKQWRDGAVLQQETRPALYLYEQTFELDGAAMTRTGFIGRVRLADYQDGVIFPHEQTLAGPKADLLRLWQACQANLSLIFGVYQDTAQTLEAVFAPIQSQTPQVRVPHWGEGQHRLWIITDPGVIAQVQRAMHGKPMVIADGHHRYETALALRDAMRRHHAASDPAAPYEYVLMYCVNIDNPGVVALPTHRLVHHMPVSRLEQVLRGLPWIRLETDRRLPDGEGLRQWQHRLELALRQRQGEDNAFAFYAGGDFCYIVTVPAAAAVQQVQVKGASDAWKRLDVSVLHHALLPALQAALSVQEPHVTYARGHDEALGAVAEGHSDLAVLMSPTPLETMAAIATGGERMPPKSTYFYPKLPTGLVINSFTT